MIAPGVIALTGAECTGKTTLARALTAELGAVLIPEALRTFVDHRGRPPEQREQAAVMADQIAAEAAARASGRWVISDAGALMTAVYSVVYYGDASLVPTALEHHRSACALTVWCDVGIPWVADEGHRDGRDHRAAGDQVIGSLLAGADLAVVRATGSVPERLAAIRTALSEPDAARD